MTPTPPPAVMMTEEQLAENVRSACAVFGWRFLWLRKTYDSSAGILDLVLIPLRLTGRRHVLHRELKGYDRNGRLGALTAEQSETIQEINAAGGDARKWEPADWHSGTIIDELK